MIENTWSKHEGKLCVGINWERFPNGLPQVQVCDQSNNTNMLLQID